MRRSQGGEVRVAVERCPSELLQIQGESVTNNVILRSLDNFSMTMMKNMMCCSVEETQLDLHECCIRVMQNGNNGKTVIILTVTFSLTTHQILKLGQWPYDALGTTLASDLDSGISVSVSACYIHSVLTK